MRIECTADGSHTLYIPEIEEHYHSVNGAMQESMHVFINAGLRQMPSSKVTILEIGFGTGLNAYLTSLYAHENNMEVSYTAFERYPVNTDIINQLNYSSKNTPLFNKIHEANWNEYVFIESFFTLKKILSDFTDFDHLKEKESFDLIYYDAFSPEKQPEMWTQNIFDYLFNHTNNEGILVTYCAKGIIRRMLQAAGFVVERIPGPPGKREMLRAQKVLMK